ncbi:MAG TPA: DUF3310 domain-containing protein [Cyclobacteriaceae bacterium]|nr:DUF3310 domain-containing protein [Cyclobacteriaceae bacterium]
MEVKSFFTCRKCAGKFQFFGSEMPSVCDECVSTKNFYKREDFVSILCGCCHYNRTVIKGSRSSIDKICIECSGKEVKTIEIKTEPECIYGILGCCCNETKQICNSKCVLCKVNDRQKAPCEDIYCSGCLSNITIVGDGLNEDRINPAYYKQGGLEPYQYLKMKLTPEQYEGWLLGDLIVYLSRYNFKHDALGQIEDIEKASWYLNKLIEFRKKRLLTIK